MKGAIIFSGQYGSTEQYANWIDEACDLPVFNTEAPYADLSDYDYLVLGSSVIVYKLTIRKWVKKHLPELLDKPVILFTVSGSPAGPELDQRVANSLPEKLVSHMEHFALRGRMNPKTVTRWHRILLRIGAWANKDPQAKKEELEGFDYMDRSVLSRWCSGFSS